LVVKYRNKDAKTVIKCTDDRVCLKFTTDQLNDLKKLDKLTRQFMCSAMALPIPVFETPGASSSVAAS
jgi:signal recognition particle subunit SRP9